MRLGIRLGRCSVHVDVAVEVVLRGDKDQGQPVLLAGLRLHLQRGKASRGVERPQTGPDFVTIHRLTGFLYQQLPKPLRVGALDTSELDGTNGNALVLTQFAQRCGKISLGSGRVGILTRGQGVALRPRRGQHAEHQQGADRRNFVERWRDWLRQTLTFSTSAAWTTSSDGTSPACHAGESASPSAVQLWRPFCNPVLTAK